MAAFLYLSRFSVFLILFFVRYAVSKYLLAIRTDYSQHPFITKFIHIAFRSVP